ncbi:hypothetical protein VULLAG_LOCUS4220 [Vulpes lagopus]
MASRDLVGHVSAEPGLGPLVPFQPHLKFGGLSRRSARALLPSPDSRSSPGEGACRLGGLGTRSLLFTRVLVSGSGLGWSLVGGGEAGSAGSLLLSLCTPCTPALLSLK